MSAISNVRKNVRKNIREAAQEIFRKHNRHEISLELTDSDIEDLKKGAKVLQAGHKPPKGVRPSEWAATIASTVKAVEAVHLTMASTVKEEESAGDNVTAHPCRVWDLGSLQCAAYYAGFFPVIPSSKDLAPLSIEKLSRDTYPVTATNSYALWLRLEELRTTSPYYAAAKAAEEKIAKLERAEDRLRKREEELQQEIAEINDQLDQLTGDK